MMSAPSSASFTACDRPWPRAAPVTNATFPATRLLTCSSFLVRESSVDGKGGTGDVATLVGDEVENRVADVGDIDEADRHGVLDVRCEFGMRFDEGPHRGSGDHRRFDAGWVHAIDPYRVGGQV